MPCGRAATRAVVTSNRSKVDSRKKDSVIARVRPSTIVFPAEDAVSANFAQMKKAAPYASGKPDGDRHSRQGETDDGDRFFIA